MKMVELYNCGNIRIQAISVACYVCNVTSASEDISGLFFSNENTANAKFAVVFGIVRSQLTDLEHYLAMKVCLLRVEQLVQSKHTSPERGVLMRRFSNAPALYNPKIRKTYIESPTSPPVLKSKYRLTRKEHANIALQQMLLHRLPQLNYTESQFIIRRIQCVHRTNLVIERFRAARSCTLTGLRDVESSPETELGLLPIVMSCEQPPHLD